MRSLRPEEKALWAKVVASVEPLSREPRAPEEAARPAKAPPPKMPPPKVPQPSPGQRARAAAAVRRDPPLIVPPPTRTHQQATLDGVWDKRLRQGKSTPDRVIDLHGHSLDGAWHRIDRGIEAAVAAGDRLVLLITGHAPKGEPPIARGKIRAAVEGWLSASRHADAIAAVRPAAPRHGGRGALYLVLRRSRGDDR
ncbi:Smr/MutS family protein [Sphingomicrobium arenosum]|uniref:Smr/MutS family protein n=1 Tax=Sphingomicrobium arenosum TaxID=2233861 RepID=UPI002ACE560C|nr:Smr/MutS family protein [Sphingomicrobium arenosum]